MTLKVLSWDDLQNIPPRSARWRGERPIETDASPVKVRGEALHPMIWRGKQWAVTEFGIENLDGTYVIEAKRLHENIDRHSWLAHMGEKTWVDTEDFATAWLVAIAVYGSKATPQQIRKAIAESSTRPDAGAAP
jgi:hypothetical protein